jgi:Na+-transporting methylmalonyl-CoA/oxaloacetate decarboxylase gamma subunit
MGLVFLVLFLLATAIAGAGVLLGVSLDSMALIIACIVVGVLVFLMLALLSSTLNGIYSAAVYRYAAEGEMDKQFAPELIREAFRMK